MQLTIPQTAKLYSKHRSTIHRNIEAGRLSCGFRGDGTRVIDMAELVRCYGEPRHLPAEMQPNATPSPDPVQQAMLQALQAMHKELVALREEVSQLRQLPAPLAGYAKTRAAETEADNDPHGLRAMARRAFAPRQSTDEDDEVSS